MRAPSADDLQRPSAEHRIHDTHDRASLLHRPLPARVRCAVVDTVAHDGPARGRARPHRVLSDVRRPAVRHRHARRRAGGRRRRSTTTAGCCTSSIGAARPGGAVHGAIDWARRFDHMQQHTGQHVLSAAFDACSTRATESFHLGVGHVARSTSRASCRPRRSPRAEDEANRVVWEDRPVAIRFASGRRGRGAAAAQGAEARGHAAADRRRGLRSVGVRRHARRAHRRDRHHRGDRRPSGSAAARGSRLSAAAARSPASARCATRRRQRARAVGAARGTARRDRAAAGRVEGCRSRRSGLQQRLARLRGGGGVAAGAQGRGPRLVADGSRVGRRAQGDRARIVARPRMSWCSRRDPPPLIVVARAADLASTPARCCGGSPTASAAGAAAAPSSRKAGGSRQRAEPRRHPRELTGSSRSPSVDYGYAGQ